jgi:hypothetical protein
VGSAKANRREPKTCLGQVFNYKFGQGILNTVPLTSCLTGLETAV